VLHHKHLAGLWGHHSSGGKKRGVPEPAHVRLHALLESMEVLWTPAQLRSVAEREKDSAEFLAKGLSFVPALFGDRVPYNWVKWETFLGRPARGRFEGEMQIDKTEFETGLSNAILNPAGGGGAVEEGELEHLGGMVGDIKFERWWIFSFLPSSFLSRFVMRLVHNVQQSCGTGCVFHFTISWKIILFYFNVDTYHRRRQSGRVRSVAGAGRLLGQRRSAGQREGRRKHGGHRHRPTALFGSQQKSSGQVRLSH
jgi:hypothetical protein